MNLLNLSSQKIRMHRVREPKRSREQADSRSSRGNDGWGARLHVRMYWECDHDGRNGWKIT